MLTGFHCGVLATVQAIVSTVRRSDSAGGKMCVPRDRYSLMMSFCVVARVGAHDPGPVGLVEAVPHDPTLLAGNRSCRRSHRGLSHVSGTRPAVTPGGGRVASGGWCTLLAMADEPAIHVVGLRKTYGD